LSRSAQPHLVAFLAVSLAACSGNASSPAPTVTASARFPVLVPGSRFTYAGRLSESITYASPSPQRPNSLGDYKTSEVTTISKASQGAPMPIEVRQDVRYTAIKVPTSGIQLQHRVADSFESLTATNATQTISQAEGITMTFGIDQTANRIEGDGPYDYRATITSIYALPRVLLVLPLVIGTTDVPLARSEATVARSANASGKTYLLSNTRADYSDAGAYRETGSIGEGETIDAHAMANGAGSLVHAGVSPLSEKIGLPIPTASQTYQIPIILVQSTGKKKFLAEDWYPGGAAPPSPLAATTQTVKGLSRIPSTCGVKVPVSDVQEVDTSSASLDVIFGTYAIGRTREFLSDGNTVCRVVTSTVFTYTVTSGRLFSTTVDSSFEGLIAASIP
jgi:hypothetical protein